MRVAKKLAGAILVAAVASGTAAIAQKNPYRNYNEDKFVENMQTAGRNYAAVVDLLAKNEHEPAKAQLTRAREQLAITITFWRDRKKDDAVKLLRDALLRMDDLDAALSVEARQSSEIRAASQRVGAACEACHALYRDQHPTTKAYRIKPGSAKRSDSDEHRTSTANNALLIFWSPVERCEQGFQELRRFSLEETNALLIFWSPVERCEQELRSSGGSLWKNKCTPDLLVSC